MKAVAAGWERCPSKQHDVWLPEEVVTLYIIGQIHGSLDAVRALDKLIVTHRATTARGTAAVLHAGGYIDKGNQVPELLGYLRDRTRVADVPVTYLLGAHEWLLRRTLTGNRRAALRWLLSGAEASLDRWEIPTTDWRASLPTAIPLRHLEFVEALYTSAVAGGTRFLCSSFAEGPARPFGLFGEVTDRVGLFDDPSVILIGNDSDLSTGSTPGPWAKRKHWKAGRVTCAILERCHSRNEFEHPPEQSSAQSGSRPHE